jgi:general nucleoside transport system permease protein
MAGGAAVERVPRGRPAWLDATMTQVIAVAVALVVAGLIGAIIIALQDEDPLAVYETIWRFSTARPEDFARVLTFATPLIFSGLAVAVAFRAGMFNIGVEGQYIVGMMTAAAAALGFRTWPAIVLLPVVVLAAMAGSMAFAAVPAILKVKTGAHEVVTTIMMNGIAGSLVAWALLGPLRTSEQGLIDLRSDVFPEAALVPTLARSFGLEDTIPGSVYLTWLFPLALLTAAGAWFLLRRMRLGYEVRAVGSSPTSAEAGGVRIGRTQLLIFLISGALAGLVGLNHLLGDRGFLAANYQTSLGFDGIAVAFLGRNSPIGVVFAAIAVGMLTRGQSGIALNTDLPQEILIILQAVLILSVVVAYEVVNRAAVRRTQRQVRAEEEGGGSAGPSAPAESAPEGAVG